MYCRERRSVSGVTPAMDSFGCFEKMEILQEGLKRSSQGQEKRKVPQSLGSEDFAGLFIEKRKRKMTLSTQFFKLRKRKSPARKLRSEAFVWQGQ